MSPICSAELGAAASIHQELFDVVVSHEPVKVVVIVINDGALPAINQLSIDCLCNLLATSTLVLHQPVVESGIRVVD